MFDLLMQCSSVGNVEVMDGDVDLGDMFLHVALASCTKIFETSTNSEKLLLQWIKLRAMFDLLMQCSSVGNVEVMDGDVKLGNMFLHVALASCTKIFETLTNSEKLLLQWIKLRAMFDLPMQCSSVGYVDVMGGIIEL